MFDTIRDFVRRLRVGSSPASKSGRRLWLSLEELEDRLVPAIFSVTGTDDTSGLTPTGGTGSQNDPFLIGSLRSAIEQANATPQADTITFAASLTAGGDAVITLTNFDTGLDTDEFGPAALRISTDITLQGPTGDNGVTIQRDTANTDRFRLFYVFNSTTASDAHLTLQNLTLEGGLAQGGDGSGGAGGAAGMGGAIFNRSGMVDLVGVTLTNNTAQGGKGGSSDAGGGGGVGSNGSEDRITGGGPNGGNNLQPAGFGGGGGYGAVGGFGGGGGGGGYDNSGGGFGGGGGNYSTPGGFGGGTGGAEPVGIGGGGGSGMGGAIFNYLGTLNITNSTLSGNFAKGGAGDGRDSGGGSGLGAAVFDYNGSVSLLNSTLAGNSVTAGAGSPSLPADLFEPASPAGPAGDASGAGLFVLSDGTGNTATVISNNTIVADSNTGVDFVATTNDGGTAPSITGGNNLVESNTGVPGGVISVTDDPKLGPLQDNGGPTPTMALQATSPAFNAANAVLAPATDQRGFTRDIAPDIGAFEYQFPSYNLVVTTTGDELDADLSDPADLSLREAIFIANGRAGADTITFAASLTAGGDAVITLTNFDTGLDTDEFGPTGMRISTDITLQGPTGDNGVTIQRDTTNMDLFRLFYVFNSTTASDAHLTLNALTLQGGLAQGGKGGPGGGAAAGMGGAIFNRGGTVDLVGVSLTNNTAQGGAGGTSRIGGGGGVGADGSDVDGGGPNGGSQAGGFGGGGGYGSIGGFGGGGGEYSAGGFGGGGGLAGNSSPAGSPGGFGGGVGGNYDGVYGGGGGAGMGGAIFNYLGTLNVTNSTLSGNFAKGGSGGGDSGGGSGLARRCSTTTAA